MTELIGQIKNSKYRDSESCTAAAVSRLIDTAELTSKQHVAFPPQFKLLLTRQFVCVIIERLILHSSQFRGGRTEKQSDKREGKSEPLQQPSLTLSGLNLPTSEEIYFLLPATNFGEKTKSKLELPATSPLPA